MFAFDVHAGVKRCASLMSDGVKCDIIKLRYFNQNPSEGMFESVLYFQPSR